MYESNAIICQTLDDCKTLCNDRVVWHPLENILEAWTSMFENGKIFANAGIGGDKFPWDFILTASKLCKTQSPRSTSLCRK
jgi:hypothetical protein